MKYTRVLEQITHSTNRNQLYYIKGYIACLKDCGRIYSADYEQLALHIERKQLELEEHTSSR